MDKEKQPIVEEEYETGYLQRPADEDEKMFG